MNFVCQRNALLYGEARQPLSYATRNLVSPHPVLRKYVAPYFSYAYTSLSYATLTQLSYSPPHLIAPPNLTTLHPS